MITECESMEHGSSGSQSHGKSKSQRRISSVAIVVYERTHLKKDYWHNKKIEKTKAISRIFVGRISYDRKSCIAV